MQQNINGSNENCPIPKGDRVAIITNSGGPGIMATDAICEHGMQMAKITDETKDKLRSFKIRRLWKIVETTY